MYYVKKAQQALYSLLHVLTDITAIWAFRDPDRIQHYYPKQQNRIHITLKNGKKIPVRVRSAATQTL